MKNIRECGGWGVCVVENQTADLSSIRRFGAYNDDTNKSKWRCKDFLNLGAFVSLYILVEIF